MRSPAPWRQEFWTVAGLLFLLWIVGVIAGLSGWLVLAGGVLYLVWNLYHSWRLVLWLDNPGNRLPSSVPGIWGYVFYRMEVRRRKTSDRKKQIGSLLKQFKSSTRALPDATVVLTGEFTILWVNDAATEILGVRKSDAGQPVTNLIRSPHLARYLDEQNYDQPLELTSLANPEQHLLLRVVPYEGGQYLLLARDITERHMVEHMRRDFIANASHELRTPLSVLQGSIEQMEQDAAGQPVFEKPLQRMRRQSERMMRILQDLLILARLEGSRPVAQQLVSLSAVVSEVADEARAASESLGSHRLQVEIEPDIYLQGEREDLHAAISNLVMNAVRYTQPGGEIRIALKRVSSGVRFQVSDTGAGILPQHVPRLTERFYRVDVGRSRESGGTGLGLSIVKHVLDRYRSQIEISSAPGKGSTFSFLLKQEILCEAGPRAVASQ